MPGGLGLRAGSVGPNRKALVERIARGGLEQVRLANQALPQMPSPPVRPRRDSVRGRTLWRAGGGVSGAPSARVRTAADRTGRLAVEARKVRLSLRRGAFLAAIHTRVTVRLTLMVWASTTR